MKLRSLIPVALAALGFTFPFVPGAGLAKDKEVGKAGIQDCKARLKARLEISNALGGDPYDPRIDPADFVDRIDNRYFPLKPGTTYVYESKMDKGKERVKFSVTRKTKVILGVRCVVVRETVTLDGQLTEDTIDWFAQDKEGNVWYFGEISKQFEDGDLVGPEGSWKAGVDGAKPGIVMEAKPNVGDRYRQEFAPGVAEDMGQVLDLDQSGIKVPFGTFDHCLLIKDFNPTQPDVNEHKYYAPGVGLVLTINLETGEREELISATPK